MIMLSDVERNTFQVCVNERVSCVDGVVVVNKRKTAGKHNFFLSFLLYVN